MPASAWSTQQLAEFLAVVSSCETEASAALAAVERAAEALDAEVSAIVSGGQLVAAVGYPEGAAPVGELDAVAATGLECDLDVPGLGVCRAVGVSLEHPPGAKLILARCGGGLTPEEASLLRGMARVTSMTMRMLRLLDDERAAREESDRQAAENAKLLAALTERQALLERLAEEQAALSRVATLVAGQAAADDIFAAVAEEAIRLLRADQGGLLRYEPDESITVVASWSERGTHIPVGTRCVLDGESLAARVLRSGLPARVDNYSGLGGPLADLVTAVGVQSAVGAPIVVDGRIWGAMVASSSQPEPLPLGTEHRLAAFSDLVATAISNAASRALLAASRARIVATADETRRRIERDLHDGIQQRLVTLALELSRTKEAVSPDSRDILAHLCQLEDGLKGVVDEVREVARGIHPAILTEGGLGPALRSLARRSSVPVELALASVGRLPEPVEVAAYYVVSEALANAAKHARASVVHVNLDVCDGKLHLSVSDDGVGGASPSGGSGIVGLTDRVEALGGTLAVASPLREGTSIVVELPI